MGKQVNMSALRQHVTQIRKLVSETDRLALQLMKHPEATANQIMELHKGMVTLNQMIQQVEPMIQRAQNDHNGYFYRRVSLID